MGGPTASLLSRVRQPRAGEISQTLGPEWVSAPGKRVYIWVPGAGRQSAPAVTHSCVGAFSVAVMKTPTLVEVGVVLYTRPAPRSGRGGFPQMQQHIRV